MSIEDKKSLCERHKIALYDAIEECDIVGSSDSSIRNVVPADIKSIVSASKIRKIILNGKKAESCFKRYQPAFENIEVLVMPSTSPANAATSFEALVECWREAF